MLKLLKFKLLLLSVVCMLMLSGCVSRSLSIRTPDPSESYEVYLDGTYAGKTPYTSKFVFYGTREVILKGPQGDITVFDIPLRRPWYEYFPLDFFSEILWPKTLQHNVEIILLPRSNPPRDLEEIRKRADAFRTEFRKISDADT